MEDTREGASKPFIAIPAQGQLNELLALVQIYRSLSGGWEQ
jgi:hypothetical protein